jgi:hypothetical protein
MEVTGKYRYPKDPIPVPAAFLGADQQLKSHGDEVRYNQVSCPQAGTT